MIFKSIRLQNFRQFKSEVNLKFAQPNAKDNNITLIIAENGVGKTTLLQSFRYCFFGSSGNYLNLPNSFNLVNNNLANDLLDTDEATMFVEVEFTHENESYIARREETFQKRNGKMNSIESNKFTLKILDGHNGWKEIGEEKAEDKIRSIMPPGLSYIFMFDGERMERSIADSNFKKELKDSILGILNIKKYDELISLIGTKGQTTSVMGKINQRIAGDTSNDVKTIQENQQFEENKDKTLEEIEKNENEIKQYQKIIDDSNYNLEKIEEIAKEQAILRNLESDFKNKEEQIESYSKEYIDQSFQLLINKNISSIKKDFIGFLKSKDDSNIIYRNLHIDTLEDILNTNICLCGDDITGDLNKKHQIEMLKNIALPIETAHNLGHIQELINISDDFDVDYQGIKELKMRITSEKSILSRINTDIRNQEKIIKNLEANYDINYMEQIDKARKKINELNKIIGQNRYHLDLVNRKLNKQEKEMEKISSRTEQNKQITILLKTLEKLIERLKEVRDQKSNEARKRLEFHFQNILSKIMQGSYTTKIDEYYNIEIFDNNNNDVTSVLSTGQNVVVSIALISALINTAKELSDEIISTEKYGIIMDAALSNVDTTHMNRLAKHSLVDMEQLIFLSFRKQLKNDLMGSIGDNVGKAYHLYKEESDSGVSSEEIELEDLYDFVNSIEGDL